MRYYGDKQQEQLTLAANLSDMLLMQMRAAAVPDNVMSRFYYDSHVTPYSRDVAPLYAMRQHDVRESTGHNLRHTDMECKLID
jgi:hypothetical protein